MINVLNIGNTNTQIGVYENGHFISINTLKTKDISVKDFELNNLTIIASVVPEVSKQFVEYDNIHFVSTKMDSNIDLSLIDSSTLGIDRFANAVNLANLANTEKIKLPAICIDFGTAITFEIINENYIFLGGVILPGRYLLRKTLHQNTSQLPLIDIKKTIDKYIGLNTEESMLSGIDNGVVGSVKSIIEGIEKNDLCKKIKSIVAIGGDAMYFIDKIQNMYQGEQYFTLNGIIKLWELNKNES